MGQSDCPEGLGEFQREFRRDPGLHATLMGVLAVFCLLLMAGISWLAIKPDGHPAGKFATALFLAALLPLMVFGIWHSRLAYRQRFRLHQHGLVYFDGRQSHAIPWNRVAEIRESVSTVKLYGIDAAVPVEVAREVMKFNGRHWTQRLLKVLPGTRLGVWRIVVDDPLVGSEVCNASCLF